jgi:hypothetical protein
MTLIQRSALVVCRLLCQGSAWFGEKKPQAAGRRATHGQQLEKKGLVPSEILSQLAARLLQFFPALAHFLFSFGDFLHVRADLLPVAQYFFPAGAVTQIPAQFGAVFSQFLNVLAQLRAILANVLSRIAHIHNALSYCGLVAMSQVAGVLAPPTFAAVPVAFSTMVVAMAPVALPVTSMAVMMMLGMTVLAVPLLVMFFTMMLFFPALVVPRIFPVAVPVR